MAQRNETIVVTGATGRQGGAVARALLKDGWKVRALVRDAAKPAAQALRQAGAELALGNLDDAASVDRAMAGAYGAFSVQASMDPAGTAREIAQGKTVADAAKRAGVQHLVYSSVVDAEKGTGVPHFESKRQVEQYIRAMGMPASVLRPVFYYENFATFFPPGLENGAYVLRLAMNPVKPLSMIAVADVGSFAALAFGEPKTSIGTALEIAGDERTMPEVAASMQEAFGKPFRFEELPIEAVRGFSVDLALMFEHFNRKGQRADIAALRKRHPGLADFPTWLKSSGWNPTR